MKNTRYAWYAVAVLTLASVSANIDRQILNLLVVPIERDLRISDTQMGFLMGPAFAILYATMGIPLATAADRWSRRNVMAIGVALWSVFTGKRLARSRKRIAASSCCASASGLGRRRSPRRACR